MVSVGENVKLPRMTVLLSVYICLTVTEDDVYPNCLESFDVTAFIVSGTVHDDLRVHCRWLRRAVLWPAVLKP